MTNAIIQVIGWAGTFLIVAAYILISQKKVSGDSRIYQFINLLGAVAVGVNVAYQEAWPAFGLQVVWGLIAIYSLIKSKSRKLDKIVNK